MTDRSFLATLQAGAATALIVCGVAVAQAQGTGPAAPSGQPAQAAPATPGGGTPAPAPEQKLQQLKEQQQHTTSGKGGKSEPSADLVKDVPATGEQAPWTTHSPQTTPSTISGENLKLDHKRDLPAQN